jgi:DnaK suppressor protein
MKENEREQLREALLAKSQHIENMFRGHLPVEGENSPVATAEKNFGLQMRERIIGTFYEVEDALRKLEKDEFYGKCEECGESIGFKRLVVNPLTSLCVECKKESESSHSHWKKLAAA